MRSVNNTPAHIANMQYYFLVGCIAVLADAKVRYKADQTYASSFSHPQFSFDYPELPVVNNKGQWEQRLGDSVQTAYLVSGHDGIVRPVQYTANEHQDYSPDVSIDSTGFHGPIVVSTDYGGHKPAGGHWYEHPELHGSQVDHHPPAVDSLNIIEDDRNHHIPNELYATASPLAAYSPKYHDYNNHIDYTVNHEPPPKKQRTKKVPAGRVPIGQRDFFTKKFRVPASAKLVIIHTGKNTKALSISPALSSKKIIIKHKGKVYKYKKGRLVQINIKKNKKRPRKPRHNPNKKIYFPISDK